MAIGVFFVLEPGVSNCIDGDMTYFEKVPLERLGQDGQLMAYRHEGFSGSAWTRCVTSGCKQDLGREQRVPEHLGLTGRPILVAGS